MSKSIISWFITLDAVVVFVVAMDEVVMVPAVAAVAAVTESTQNVQRI